MALLELQIRKRFEKFKLNVSLEAGAQVTGLLGASGCGKSMTLKCIAGIETPDEGRIVLDGRVLFDSEKRINLTPQERRVGYLFQHYALFPNMTVLQNVAAGARVKGREARRAKAESLIRAFYLEGMEHKYPRQLSGGQQQRVALARILASEPEALLLDEPFSALDSYLKWQVELEMMDLLAKFPGPVLFVTHSRDEVYHLCQRVCVLNKGRSEPVQPVRELFDAPRTLSACLLSGCKNVSRAQALPDGRVRALDWGTDFTCAQTVPQGLAWLGARAHYIRPVDGPGENRCLCRVLRVVEDVFSTVVMLATPGGDSEYAQLRIELNKDRWAALSNPAELWLEFRPEDLLLLTEG